MKALVTCLVLVAFACGKEEPTVKQAPPDAPRFTLTADPGEALSVLKAKEMGPGEEVVVEGRISNIVKGRVLFNLVDESLDYCGKKTPEGCKTPWDYCCVDAGERADGTLVIEARGADGKVEKGAPADLRLLDLVAVKGKVEKDEHDNVTVVATGWFRRERPTLPDGLNWPE